MKKISICIPTHNMGGVGVKFLEESFIILCKQTFKDFNVIVSDHSNDDLIKDLCLNYSDRLDIKYLRNKNNIGSSSTNINNAINNADGELIKILFLDDFLFNETAIEDIVNNFNLNVDNWLVTACEHSKDGKNFYRPFYPKYNKFIYLGKNTISSPSILTIKNKNPLLFDEKLKWLMDVDYYKRCYDRFGKPKILNKINIVNRTGEHQGVGGYKSKNVADNELLKKTELSYIISKYNKKINLMSFFYIILSNIKYIIKKI